MCAYRYVTPEVDLDEKRKIMLKKRRSGKIFRLRDFVVPRVDVVDVAANLKEFLIVKSLDKKMELRKKEDGTYEEDHGKASASLGEGIDMISKASKDMMMGALEGLLKRAQAMIAWLNSSGANISSDDNPSEGEEMISQSVLSELSGISKDVFGLSKNIEEEYVVSKSFDVCFKSEIVMSKEISNRITEVLSSLSKIMVGAISALDSMESAEEGEGNENLRQFDLDDNLVSDLNEIGSRINEIVSEYSVKKSCNVSSSSSSLENKMEDDIVSKTINGEDNMTKLQEIKKSFEEHTANMTQEEKASIAKEVFGEDSSLGKKDSTEVDSASSEKEKTVESVENEKVNESLMAVVKSFESSVEKFSKKMEDVVSSFSGKNQTSEVVAKNLDSTTDSSVKTGKKEEENMEVIAKCLSTLTSKVDMLGSRMSAVEGSFSKGTNGVEGQETSVPVAKSMQGKDPSSFKGVFFNENSCAMPSSFFSE